MIYRPRQLARNQFVILAVVQSPPCVGPGCVLCPRIDPLCFLAGCHRRRLNQGLVVALEFFSLLDMACFCVIYLVYGCMLCLVRYLFVISTSVIDCLGRFVPEMTYYASSGTLKLTQLYTRAVTEATISWIWMLLSPTSLFLGTILMKS